MSIFKMADVSYVVFPVRLCWTTHIISLTVWVLSSNFGLIGCMVTETLQFLDFGNINLAWKWLLTPLWWVFRTRFHMPLVVLSPKRTILGLNHVIWAIKREYRPRGSGWALEREKRYSTGQEGKFHKRVIFHLLGENPPLKQCTSKTV